MTLHPSSNFRTIEPNFRVYINLIILLYELCHEKTCFFQMKKQRRGSVER